MAKENGTRPVRRRNRKKVESSKGFVKVIIGDLSADAGNNAWYDQGYAIGSKVEHREILFPTEPTSIDPARIDRAIELVMSRRK